MKTLLVMSGCGLMAIQAAAAAGGAVLEQRTQSFTIVLKGPVAKATPLFGPVREAEWAPTWTPRFIHRRKVDNARVSSSPPQAPMAGSGFGCSRPMTSRRAV